MPRKRIEKYPNFLGARVSKKDYDKVAKYADKNGTNVSDLIREWIKKEF